MATVYSGYSKVWTPSGGKDKKYRSFLTYSVSTAAEKVTVTAYMGVNINSSVSATFSAKLTATGYSDSTGTGKTVYNSSGSGRTVTIISTKTFTYTRTTANQTKKISASVKSTNGSWTGEWKTVSVNVSVPAKGSYAVSYDANGGEGSIEGQTKYYNTALSPLRDGTGFTWANHTLLNWNTNASGTGTNYPLKGTLPASVNSNITLYAVWKVNAIGILARISGAWKKAIIYAKVNGVWKMPYAGYVKVNGVWKQIKGD